MTREDFVAVRAALVAAGFDADFWNGWDLEELFKRGNSVEQIVKLTRECAADSGRRTA